MLMPSKTIRDKKYSTAKLYQRRKHIYRKQAACIPVVRASSRRHRLYDAVLLQAEQRLEGVRHRTSGAVGWMPSLLPVEIAV